MKICIVDKYLKEDMFKKLESFGFIVIKTKEIQSINSSLSTHPDIQVCKINDNKIIVEPSVYDYYEKHLSKYDIIVKSGRFSIKNNYPMDSYYNAAINKKLAIHNFNITDNNILSEIKVEKVQVKQGYSKCNILFTKDGVITSDKGIFNKLSIEKKLLISSGNILLKDFDYGFIGGASGYFDKVYFIGNIDYHPDSEKIKEFLKEENTEYENLSNEKLIDMGSLIFLKTKEEIK